MSRQAQIRLFAQLINELTPELRRGFMAGVTDLYSNVDWKALIDGLTNGDIDAAVAALHITSDAWTEYSAIKTDIYANAGASTAAQIRQAGIAGIGIRFRMTDPHAQLWIEQNVGEFITRITNEQIRTVRQVISEGFEKGNHPYTIGRDIVGRVNPLTKIREGGVIGLDVPRAERLQAVTNGMRTAEGVKSLVIEHDNGTRSLRYKVNKSTADRILKAYDAGTEVPAAQRVISERQYSNALLKARADTVAQTETANAVLAARDEQWRQFTEDSGIDPSTVTKTWYHRRGSSAHARPDHIAMSGKMVVGIDTPFVFPDGAQLRYPHDSNGGAAHVINCGCDVVYSVNRRAEQ